MFYLRSKLCISSNWQGNDKGEITISVIHEHYRHGTKDVGQQ